MEVLLVESSPDGLEDDLLLSGVVVEEAVTLGLLAVDEGSVDGDLEVASSGVVHVVEDAHAGGKFLED